MNELTRVISEIVPPLYEAVATDRMPPHVNMASSNQCHVLSKGLHDALTARQLEARREYHKLQMRMYGILLLRTRRKMRCLAKTI